MSSNPVAGKTANGVRLRPVTLDDAMLLFGWLNRPDRIASSLQTSGPVKLDDHLAWLDARMNDLDCHIWILDTPDGPAGQLRLQDSPDGAEVSVYVADEHRGRGVAAAALEAAARHCRSHMTHGRLLARVRRDNPGSLRLFSKAGYAVIEEHEDHVLMAAAVRSGLLKAPPA